MLRNKKPQLTFHKVQGIHLGKITESLTGWYLEGCLPLESLMLDTIYFDSVEDALLEIAEWSPEDHRIFNGVEAGLIEFSEGEF
jgi:hypothetical protein